MHTTVIFSLIGERYDQALALSCCFPKNSGHMTHKFYFLSFFYIYIIADMFWIFCIGAIICTQQGVLCLLNAGFCSYVF